MCAISGVVYDEPRDSDGILRLMRRMCEAQGQRGPDDRDVWTDGRVGLGMVRLAVVGSADRGRQPIQDTEGNQLVVNGELYRPGEVMANLNHEFAGDDCDGAALLCLLRRRGVEGLRNVSAMFGLAFYTQSNGSVLLARDAWGQKPLYFKRIEGGYAFASTLRSLREASGPLRIRDDAMYEALVFKSVGGNQSAFEQVFQVPAGSWLQIDRGGTVSRGRWFDPPVPDLTAENPADHVGRVQDILEEAIRVRCPSGHRAAVFLSGGLDSSIVAAIASRYAQPAPHVFTVGYDLGGWEDEHGLAIKLAEELGLEHESIILAADDVPDLMRDTAVALEDPVHDPVTVPTLALSRAAAAETKVVLTGDGSDEFWGGYSRFDEPTDDLNAYLHRTLVFEPGELGLDDLPASYLDEIRIPPAGSMPALDRILRLETANRLRNYHLARLDKLSMNVALEARSPFLDREVTSHALSLPAATKRAGGRPKGLLIDAFSNELPTWLLERRKQPFSVPVRGWLQGKLRAFCHDTLSSPNAYVREITDPAPWLQLLDGSINERQSMCLWSLLHLEIWHQAFGNRMEKQL